MKRIKQYTTGLCVGGLILLSGRNAVAQKGINSLYSAYSIGDIEQRDYSRNFGVSSTGIARRSDYFLNELNPASYSAIPRQHFMFDVALRAQSINYKDANTLNQQAGDVNIKRLALGFKANNRWGISAGFASYSTVNYKLLSTTDLDGSQLVTTTEGTGGINKAYISNAVKLTKNFSVGVSSNFLFGPNNNTQNVGGDTVSTRMERYAFNLNFNTGIQYTGKIGKNWQLGIGGTYRFKTTMNYENKLYIVNSSSTTLYTDPDLARTKVYLPEQIGAGFSLGNGTLTWLADYRTEKWGSAGNQTTNYNLVNSDRYSTGLEYTFHRTYYNQQIEGIVAQAGFSYYNSNLVIKNNQIRDVSGTAGVSIPSRSGALRYYIGIEVGQRGTTSGGLIKETYVNGVLHFSLRDIWFIRRTYE
ncbi:hypothetical protein SAMN05518672_104686 [Chitinophaga sp. CF118]|uniref:hypothetical protein n=1 Tax=Chitinophaga sp. CF118 TaxID=1884367 RepID=UPI0008EB192B|nr:hypothetical protein [Chitinophaga sp. CF118]SFE15496.1 hypothetical protein SAMN05518672_104686 [Chitinophaga sp. CF118]